MGILDDAIKEHLELKRRHGAAESELKQLEDEAFGAAERPGSEAAPPDPLAEAPTEFMEQPDAEPQGSQSEEAASRPAPRAEIADLQEAPPSSAEEDAAAEPPAAPEATTPEPESPAEEESPAAEHEVPTGPTTDQREAIAEQPTEMYDVEEELAASQAEAPSEEDLLEEGLEEPRLAPVDPLAGLDETGGEVEVQATDAGAVEDEDDEDDDFWDEKRLSDELDQALEAPSESGDEEEVFSEPEPEPDPESAAEAEEQEPPAQPEEAQPEEQASHDDEDVLEETPDFLEETPEDDQLWFEQKPPKDFDFDD